MKLENIFKKDNSKAAAIAATMIRKSLQRKKPKKQPKPDKDFGWFSDYFGGIAGFEKSGSDGDVNPFSKP